MANEQQAVKADNKPVKVKLLSNHTHAGEEHKAGEEITLLADDAAWLINLGGAEAVKP
jgi:hypothetical protein